MIKLSIAVGMSIATGFMCYYIGCLMTLHRLKAELRQYRHRLKAEPPQIVLYGPDYEVAERKIEDGMEMARFTDKE